MKDSGAIEYHIYGPPGCGKTSYISSKVAELADVYGGDQISVCSMTKAAVREIVSRDIPIPEENVTTLHARCKRALGTGPPAESRIKEFAKAYPKHANDMTLPAYLLRGITESDSTDEVLLTGGGISVYEKMQILRQQLVPRKHWPKQVLHWSSVWNQWCIEAEAMDFTGWLETAMQLNALPPQQVIFIDEAQDHTPLQIAVIRAWPARHRILVGDDDQGIYEWSGAVPMTFLSPELPDGQEKVLSQSYRVPKAVHALASKWIGQVKLRKAKEYSPKDAEGEVVMTNTKLSDAKFDDYAISDLLTLDGRSHMILTTCGFQLLDVIKSLKTLEIPFHNPYRKSNAAWNPLAGPLSIMRSFVVGDQEWTGEEVIRWASILKAKQIFRRGGQKRLLDACEELGDEHVNFGLIEKCVLPGMLNRVMNQDIDLFMTERKIGVPGDWKYVRGVVDRYGIEVTPEIIIGTIHSVKGGEADDVLLFPDLSVSGNREYLGKARDGVIRLFYVAMTRAKNRLILCEASSHNAINWKM